MWRGGNGGLAWGGFGGSEEGKGRYLASQRAALPEFVLISVVMRCGDVGRMEWCLLTCGNHENPTG